MPGFPIRRRAREPRVGRSDRRMRRLRRVEPPDEAVVRDGWMPGAPGDAVTVSAVPRRGAEAEFIQPHIRPFVREAAQHAGEQSEVLGLAEHQHHRVEVAGQEADAQHQTTSMMSVAWQSSSVPTSPSGHLDQPHLRPFVVDDLQHLGGDAADEAELVAGCDAGEFDHQSAHLPCHASCAAARERSAQPLARAFAGERLRGTAVASLMSLKRKYSNSSPTARSVPESSRAARSATMSPPAAAHPSAAR